MEFCHPYLCQDRLSTAMFLLSSGRICSGILESPKFLFIFSKWIFNGDWPKHDIQIWNGKYTDYCVGFALENSRFWGIQPNEFLIIESWLYIVIYDACCTAACLHHHFLSQHHSYLLNLFWIWYPTKSMIGGLGLKNSYCL